MTSLTKRKIRQYQDQSVQKLSTWIFKSINLISVALGTFSVKKMNLDKKIAAVINAQDVQSRIFCQPFKSVLSRVCRPSWPRIWKKDTSSLKSCSSRSQLHPNLILPWSANSAGQQRKCSFSLIFNFLSRPKMIDQDIQMDNPMLRKKNKFSLKNIRMATPSGNAGVFLKPRGKVARP